MEQEAVECIAHADATRLGIEHNGTSLLQVGKLIQVGVADACTRLDDGDGGLGTYEASDARSETAGFLPVE